MTIDPILHELTVSLAQEGYIDCRHPRWKERTSRIEALRQTWLYFGLEVIEDDLGRFVYLKQTTSLPGVGNLPSEIEPMRRPYTLRLPELALVLTLRRKWSHWVIKNGYESHECEVQKAEVIEETSSLWQNRDEKEKTKEILEKGLASLRANMSWLRGTQDEKVIVIHAVIEAEIDLARIEEIERALQAWLSGETK